MHRALSLFSGGLDSMLATLMVKKQGIEVYGIHFITPFISGEEELRKKVINRRAKKIGIEVKIVKTGSEYIKLIKNPEHGYGKNLNPCIDCRIFFLKEASKYMKEIGASFILTGEVVGQRPMSQRKEALKMIDRESGLEGLILRPLSAGLLKPTRPEKEGIVDREEFLDISGRSRKKQFDLAQKFNIEDYSSPAGGCLLTDPGFSKRVRDSIEHEEYNVRDLKLLKLGRHFRLPGGNKLIVGRNKEENSRLLELVKKKDIYMDAVGCGSPICVLKRGDENDLELSAKICARYSNCKSEKVEVKIVNGNEEKIITVKPLERGREKSYLI